MTGNNQRRYLETHPWLTFSFDASHLDYRIWLLLGEAQSKCEHIIGAPLLPGTIEYLSNVYLAKGALATTAIEGNTLTEEQVQKRIIGELHLPPSKEYLGQEIDNILEAYNGIGDQLLNQKVSDALTFEKIQSYNKLVLKNLPLNDEVIPGEIRTYSVNVAGYRGAPSEDCTFLLNRYITWLNDEFIYPKEQRGIYGILKAILSHLYFVWIHPFGDGNGRTARLIEFQILLAAGVPSVAAHLLSNHYNQTRSEYYRCLDRTSKPGGDVSDFIFYALQGFDDGLKSEIEAIQGEQIKVHWINHIHNTFHGKTSKADERQKELMLELAKNDQIEFSFTGIRHSTPRIAEIYANLSDRTLQRDIVDLLNKQLIVKIEDHLQINLQILKQFQAPVRKSPDE
jgi:Fic family protein